MLLPCSVQESGDLGSRASSTANRQVRVLLGLSFSIFEKRDPVGIMVTGISGLCPRQLVSPWAVPWPGLCRALTVGPEEQETLSLNGEAPREAVLIPETAHSESGMRAEGDPQMNEGGRHEWRRGRGSGTPK